MLGNEYRVSAIWSLFAVIGDERWHQAFGNEILGVREHQGQAFVMQIGEVFAPQLETAAKDRFGQCSEEVVRVFHACQKKLSC